MRMAKSRQKKLDERWGLERNAAGHRFKASIFDYESREPRLMLE